MSIRSPQPAIGSLKIQRSYTPPAPYVVQIHEHDCNCAACAPYVARRADTLSAATIGKLMVAGIVCGLATILTIDPNGAVAALPATVGLI
jgi:hypothetical protein